MEKSIKRLNKRARKIEKIVKHFCKKRDDLEGVVKPDVRDLLDYTALDCYFYSKHTYNFENGCLTIRAWLCDKNYKKIFIKNLKEIKNLKIKNSKDKLKPIRQIRVETPKASKEYECSDCGSKIEKGKVYTYIFGLDGDNKSKVFRLCAKCSKKRGI